ncbi:MAG TPA: hypothetical protein VFA69_08455, partial [Candidatus Nitrosotalea sp.]|nr:hypothetical protein [Candidatus Nitrosotalea sp.]
NLNVKDILAFLAIPILSFILFWNMELELAKKGFQYDDTLRNNLKFILSGIGCSAIFAVIAGAIILK